MLHDDLVSVEKHQGNSARSDTIQMVSIMTAKQLEVLFTTLSVPSFRIAYSDRSQW